MSKKGDRHALITINGKPTTIEALEGTKGLYKIPVEGSPSPLTFTLDVPICYQKADFTLYCSLNQEESPDHENNDKQIFRKKKFLFPAPKFRRHFQSTDIIYIGVISEVGCSFNMTVTSPP